MAKRGETRPWRVRFEWEDSGVHGTETRGTRDQALDLVRKLQDTANRRGVAVTITVTERTSGRTWTRRYAGVDDEATH